MSESFTILALRNPDDITQRNAVNELSNAAMLRSRTPRKNNEVL